MEWEGENLEHQIIKPPVDASLFLSALLIEMEPKNKKTKKWKMDLKSRCPKDYIGDYEGQQSFVKNLQEPTENGLVHYTEQCTKA